LFFHWLPMYSNGFVYWRRFWLDVSARVITNHYLKSALFRSCPLLFPLIGCTGKQATCSKGGIKRYRAIEMPCHSSNTFITIRFVPNTLPNISYSHDVLGFIMNRSAQPTNLTPEIFRSHFNLHERYFLVKCARNL
jgi:hypothetical protein